MFYLKKKNEKEKKFEDWKDSAVRWSLNIQLLLLISEIYKEEQQWEGKKLAPKCTVPMTLSSSSVKRNPYKCIGMPSLEAIINSSKSHKKLINTILRPQRDLASNKKLEHVVWDVKQLTFQWMWAPLSLSQPGWLHEESFSLPASHEKMKYKSTSQRQKRQCFFKWLTVCDSQSK